MEGYHVQLYCIPYPTLASHLNVMFPNECVVYLGARSQNVFIWSKQNPHFFEEVAQHPPHVMMWAGVTNELIIGPYFFDVPVTGESYLGLMSHWLIPELDKVGLLNSVILQQDGHQPIMLLMCIFFLNNQVPLWMGYSLL
jgi:hypothetical protein